MQGDLIPNCPIVKPPSNIETKNQLLKVSFINSIILTQSCDLENGKVEIVLVSHYFTLQEFMDSLPIEQTRGKGRDNIIRNLKQGNLPAYHLLNKDEKCGLSDCLVVDFRNVYGIHFDYLKKFSAKLDNRVRLLPPYREHLSQAFARYFMRVGLPMSIDL